ncbi:MAG: tripartite tricarboxylate transporter substrate binding protein [Actinobacteria bacterium]|nr:tripartite tricarboxylate transporter substrate binding protein [Actinomycetota bacterium]
MIGRSRIVSGVTALILATLLAGCGGAGTGPGGPQSSPTKESKPTEAAKWPKRDITIIVPYKPGGGYDLTARIAAPLLSKYLPEKVNVIVQNVPGAGGKVGTLQTLNSKPDGYTLGIQDPLPLAIMGREGDLGSLDPRSITYLGQLDASPSLMVVGAGSGFKRPADMRGKPVRFGVTTDTTMGSRALAEALGAKATLVTYDGLPEACLAAARGDVDAVVNIFGTVNKQVNALQGKLVPFLIVGGDRMPALPETPAAKESGLKLEDAAFTLRHVIVGPPNLPKDVVEILTAAIDKVVHDPDFVAGMKKAGYPPVPLTAAEMQKAVDQALAAVEKYHEFIPKK